MTETFLYDTYALIEILNKNPNYDQYTDKEIIINDFIFAEFSYQLIVGKAENKEEILDEVEPAIIFPNPEILKKAMKFRYENKKKKMSMTDCVSYTMAREMGVKFLTGDKEFEGLENVEFVKK
ncbi:MAG: type II toxin-antitoxin system VapC family toxin [Nanoarchaeota archaeon]|nr:type II toxin-antitoxin system VapC family toxin [Nanoarchaeota archaeon]